MLYALGDKVPQILGSTYFITDTATIVGDVVLGNNVSVWFGAVIRGDDDSISIGENTNIQDNCVLHADIGYKLEIGQGVTVGHAAILHGCKVGNNSLIGIKSVILNGVQIGENCLIGANTLLTQNMYIPDNSLVLGAPGKIIRPVTIEEIISMQKSAKHYVGKIAAYVLTLNELVD
jgi:carbonic anhydrase/acetyltransferase-like protein (isoleucine patch superfamily)